MIYTSVSHSVFAGAEDTAEKETEESGKDSKKIPHEGKGNAGKGIVPPAGRTQITTTSLLILPAARWVSELRYTLSLIGVVQGVLWLIVESVHSHRLPLPSFILQLGGCQNSELESMDTPFPL